MYMWLIFLWKKALSLSLSLSLSSLSLSLSLQILEHVSLIPEQSRVSLYIRKTLTKKRRSGGGRGGEGRGEHTDHGEEEKALPESGAGNMKVREEWVRREGGGE